jgi:hypothetical protein
LHYNGSLPHDPLAALAQTRKKRKEKKKREEKENN